MPTRRVPIHRRQRTQFSARAIEAFRAMQATGWDETSDEFRKLYDVLHDELRLPPWEYPGGVEHPDYVSEYPPGSPGDVAFSKAQALYRRLDEASSEYPNTKH